MILKLLLNIQMICKMFVKILKNAIYDMIADMICNKKLNPILTELFIRGRKLNILKCQKCQTKFYTFFYHENSK